MKSNRIICNCTQTSLITILLLLNSTSHAQSPPEVLLQEMVQQLQSTPDDKALREKLIKLAVEITPAPAIPETAREPFVMATTIIKKASDPAGVNLAVDLFSQALKIAPWFADAYFNRSIAHETAGQFDAAMDDLNFYLAFKLSEAERRQAQDKIYALKAGAKLASVKQAELDSIANAEAEKYQAEQARRNVITQIKNVVNNRNYNSFFPSYSDESRLMYGGVTQYELFGAGQYWMFGNYDYYIYFWKFFDERVEVWVTNNNGSQNCLVSGDSWGPNINDMRWYNGCDPDPNQQKWGYFDLQSGWFYWGFMGSPNRPINDAEFDPNVRYMYTVYSPPQ